MTEHEKFKWICDTIRYDCFYETGKKGFYFKSFRDNNLDEYLDDGEIFWSGREFHKLIEEQIYIEINVREIIFTDEFFDKLFVYCILKYEGEAYELIGNILSHLDDPTSYLYNLLGGPTHENK